MQTILIADDEQSIRRLIEITLESPDCRLLQASNGTSALEIAIRELPDLIVLDWMMPGMTGLEVVANLRQHKGTERIPIILLTAMGQEKNKQQGLAAGALAYLVKPFSPLELLHTVQQVLAGDTPHHEASNESGTALRARPKLAFSA